MMGLLTNLLLGSSFAAIVAAGQAPQWDGVRPTTVAESLRADGIGFSPMPTEPPEFEMLKKRGANTFPPYVCGFVTGDQANSVYCSSTRTCVINSVYSAQACCLANQNSAISAQWTGCYFYTSCLAYAQISSGGSPNSLVTTCDSGEPYCFTYSYTDIGYANYGCSTRAYISLVSTDYIGDSGSSATAANSNGIFGTKDTASNQPTTTGGPATTDQNPGGTTTVTAPPTATPTPTKASSKSNAGAIAGGVVGGLAGLALIVALIAYLLIRNKRKGTTTNTGQGAVAPGPGPDMGYPQQPQQPMQYDQYGNPYPQQQMPYQQGQYGQQQMPGAPVAGGYYANKDVPPQHTGSDTVTGTTPAHTGTSEVHGESKAAAPVYEAPT